MSNQPSYCSVFSWFATQARAFGENDALIVYDNEDRRVIKYCKLYSEVQAATVALLEKNSTKRQIVLLFQDNVNQTVCMLAAIALGIPFLLFDFRTTPITRIINSISKDDFICTDIINLPIPNMADRNIMFFSNISHTAGSMYNWDDFCHQDRKEPPLYIAQTSGSSGKSKQMVIRQKGLMNYISWRNNAYQIQSSDHILQLLSPAFDGYLSNFFSAILSGATLVTCDYRNMNRPLDIFSREAITQLSVTPSILSFFVEQATSVDLPYLRHVVLGGEKCSETLLKTLYRLCPSIHVANEYGMAENCIATTANENFTVDDMKNIGKPIPGTEIYLLDSHQNPVPIGEPGEVYVKGIGLTEGYLGEDELTSHHFIRIPTISPNLLYRSGDYCMILPSGDYRFLYRKDRQVKINGCRVELDEIAYAIQCIDAIKRAYVYYESSDNGEPILEAFLCIDTEITCDEILKHLNTMLMPYMIPQRFYQIDDSWQIHAKVTRKDLLPVSRCLNLSTQPLYDQTTNEEDRIFTIWCEVLQHNMFDNKSNFFDVGGNSYLVSKLYTKILKIYPIKLSVLDLYRYNTIVEQAQLIKTRM